MLKIAGVLGAVLALSGCAGTDYGGVNYGSVSMTAADGATETWRVVGGKDEANVSLEIVRPDGTKVTYRADNSTATSALAANAQTQAQVSDKLTGLLSTVLPLVAGAAK